MGGRHASRSRGLPCPAPWTRNSAFRTVRHDLPALGDAVADTIEPLLDRPYALFGYSLGARVAYMTAHALSHRARPAPVHLVVAAHASPGSLPWGKGLAYQSDEELIRALIKLGRTSPAVLADNDLRRILLPALRADFRLLDQVLPLSPLACPIVAYGGLRDPVVTLSDLHKWSRYGRSPFRLRLFDGGHFFFHDHAGALTSAIALDMVNAQRTVREAKAPS
jgi:surfactin synthase thioesterase subunit